jgi:hypothetical protein
MGAESVSVRLLKSGSFRFMSNQMKEPDFNEAAAPIF